MNNSKEILNENSFIDSHILRFLAIINDNQSHSDQLHINFLKMQQQSLLALDLLTGNHTKDIPSEKKSRPVITKQQLEAFGTGSIAECFGKEFEILDQRLSPRIPNGDLLMINHVLSITGERRNLNSPASIITELYIPEDAWFLTENNYPGVPYSILMEMALQPCGIISAYLGTSLVLPEDVNTFRNLDGKITTFSNPQLAGQTVTNNAKLLSSFSSGGMHIQNYAFELSLKGSVFLAGESSFGYFTAATMKQQTGLDIKGSTSPDVNKRIKNEKTTSKSLDGYLSTKGHLALIDNLNFEENAGVYKNGIIFGEKTLNGNEWFYKNHFYQDPVMPGSLGFETVLQSIWAYINHFQKNAENKISHIDFSSKKPLTWKYRGQVIPTNQKIYFEIHIKTFDIAGPSLALTADADFWVDGIRIYAFKDISLTSH